MTVADWHAQAMTPLRVPLVVAALGLVSTVVGIVDTQIMANRRERESWQRETDRERERWQREDHARTFEHRRVAYVEFYESLRAMMLRAYDHRMGLSDEGNELPEGWQTDAPAIVRAVTRRQSPSVLIHAETISRSAVRFAAEGEHCTNTSPSLSQRVADRATSRRHRRRHLHSPTLKGFQYEQNSMPNRAPRDPFRLGITHTS